MWIWSPLRYVQGPAALGNANIHHGFVLLMYRGTEKQPHSILGDQMIFVVMDTIHVLAVHPGIEKKHNIDRDTIKCSVKGI